eukprot:6177042-Pleurochrysis_carterae.AAC.3
MEELTSDTDKVSLLLEDVLDTNGAVRMRINESTERIFKQAFFRACNSFRDQATSTLQAGVRMTNYSSLGRTVYA